MEATIEKRLSETRRLLEQGREEAAEKRIEQDFRNRPQSVDWHQEKAADFLRVAFSAQESGDSQTAQRAARLAWAQLDKVEALSADDAEALSAIAELRGVIRERLWGTTEMAIGEYKKAFELKPDPTSTRLKHSLAMPSASEATAAKK